MSRLTPDNVMLAVVDRDPDEPEPPPITGREIAELVDLIRAEFEANGCRPVIFCGALVPGS